MGSLKYLVRQGLALRGHEEENGNFFQFLKNIAEDDPRLMKFKGNGSKHYLRPEIQNEIILMMSHGILHGVADTIRALQTIQFSIIIHGTQDISGKEQEAICLRYVDHDLIPHEVFIGLYRTNDTTGKGLADMASDVLVRLNLPLSGLRSQTYDGSANMAGKYSGTQAVLKEKQPLALYIHCGAQCVNLITQKAVLASVLIHDALDWVHQLGLLLGQSGKSKAMLEYIAITQDMPYMSLKPLCPTRWVVRNRAITAVLNQYELVLTGLKEISLGSSSTASTANGLKEQFFKGKTVLGLILASAVISELEVLNTALQGRTKTTCGMRAAVDCVQTSLNAKRNDSSFHTLFTKASQMVETLHVDPIEIPKTRHAPKRLADQRFSGPSLLRITTDWNSLKS